jgi:hypothetical protein
MRAYKQQITKNIYAECLITKNNDVINIQYQVMIDEVTQVNCDNLEIEIHMSEQASEAVNHYMIIGKNKGDFVLYSKTESVFLDEELFKKLRINIKTKRG